MPKLIEVNLLNKILGFLGGSSSSDRKSQFIKNLKKSDPTLAKSFETWENDFLKLLKASKAVKVKHGMDTTEVDKLIQKYS
jgi:hypothetical protein